MANNINVYNPRLRNYELQLEKHLRNVLLQIEEQIRKQDLSLRTIRLRNQRLRNDEPGLRKELKRLNRELVDNETKAKGFGDKHENDDRAHNTAVQQMDEARDELLAEIQREKELRIDLDSLNSQIHQIQIQYDSVAWPERNDVRLMKNMVGKAKTNVNAVEKEKRIQDAYLERLRKDVEIGENELEQLAITVKLMKSTETSGKNEYQELKDRLETYESGTLQLEDHFAKLMKSLQNNRNKVRLLDKRKQEMSRVDQIRSSVDPLTQSTQKSAALTKRIARLSNLREKQEARIMKREAANQHLRVIQHKQQQSMPEIDRSLYEAEKTREKLRIRCAAVEDEHEIVRRERRSDFQPSDVHTISESFETLERELFLNEFKLSAYRKVMGELDELVKERKASDKLAPSADYLSAPLLQRSRSVNDDTDEGVWRGAKTYSRIRDSITDLVRRKVALEYRKKRLEEKIREKERQHSDAKNASEALYRSQNELEKQHQEKRIAALPVVDANQVDEKDPESVLEQKLTDTLGRVHSVQIDVKSMLQKLEEARAQCDQYRAKIGDFEALERMAEKRVESLNEIHSLQKIHQQTEKELWHVQKELEYTVMRRDYAVNRARTVLGTHNEIRVQRQFNNNKLREEIFRLEQDVQNTTNSVL
ncbi:hypothetical protein M3Y94_00465900 [Aphelenchoides besseyi]|nr:hypothetical protein M3Y94_00465900 [Aphelenchoides besseyi]KAI6229168.1 hypothetical protein M3Y95_00502900 [Aphelenchoides besseyi]